MHNPDNETRQRILGAADELFSARGYAATRLRDIASKVGMKHASLYYYAPGGKEQIFVEVMERNLRHHREGMERAIHEAGPDLRDKLRAVGFWLLSQPPLDLVRMQYADMPAISPEKAEYLMWLAYDSLRLPLQGALQQALDQGQIDITDFNMAVLSFIALVESIHGNPMRYTPVAREQLVEKIIDMLLKGWLKR
jgi:AcrR family transcriptional regulator